MKSLLSLLSYLGSGEYRNRYLGVPIPPTNIEDDQLDTARRFASGLADRFGVATSSSSHGQSRGASDQDA